MKRRAPWAAPPCSASPMPGVPSSSHEAHNADNKAEGVKDGMKVVKH